MRPRRSTLMAESFASMSDNEYVCWFLRQVKRYPLLSTSEQFRLSRQMCTSSSNESTQKLVLHCQGYVLHLAIRFMQRENLSRDILPDLVQWGNIGLLCAVRKYKYRCARSFVNYAMWWIYEQMTRGLDNFGRTIRQPLHIEQLRRNEDRLAGVIYGKYGHKPTDTEIASVLKCPVGYVKSLQTLPRVTQYFGMVDDIAVSYPQPYSDEFSCYYHGPEDVLLLRDEWRELRATLSSFVKLIFRKPNNTRNAQVFCLRYGFDGYGKMRKLEELGQMFAFSRERARQIIARVWECVRRADSTWTEPRLLQAIDDYDALSTRLCLDYQIWQPHA